MSGQLALPIPSTALVPVTVAPATIPAGSILDAFHPVIQTWFARRFASGPTEPQARGWAEILAGRDTLIAAPTGSGKTLAAFLTSLDRLYRAAESGLLEDRIEVVYVSPLKALSTDIQRNLEEPLREISATAAALGYPPVEIRTWVRTGDTPAAERQKALKKPPHILITTPESLYLMATAAKSREALRHVRTVIVDEIHALVRDKRGSHLSLTLARLDHLAHARPARIGLSATQRPIEETARFLVGTARVQPDTTPECSIVDVGHLRSLKLEIATPRTELAAVASGEQWNDLYDRLAELIRAHRTTLVFVNTRRAAERVAHALVERLGEEQVASHHGSLAKERRLELETRLKLGRMKAVVATASLELGIDVGTVDLVCQLESPRQIATFLQRVGRSGHALGLEPHGVLFPLTRDDLVECAALVRAVRGRRLDKLCVPRAPLDIVAQQIVAECAGETWREDDLFDLVREAWPYAALERRKFDEIVEMLSEGIATGTGRAAAHLHRDRIHGTLRGRRGARMVAVQCGGAIPELADYKVVAEPEGAFVGTVDEDFAIESMAGDIFLLGTTSWKIRRIESGVVRVENAHGAPPTIPFWFGEAPGRSIELSEEVAALRTEVDEQLTRTHGEIDEALLAWLAAEAALARTAAEELARYVRAQKAALGVLPTTTELVLERFFDESGGTQVVLHAPFGSRINRAIGLTMRKRFCRSFDFELQAAASDDAVLLSLGAQQSFPLEDLVGLLRPDGARETLIQALLAAPMFGARWRWNTTRALAVLRQRNGRRVPPPIQRMRAEDLLAAVFPRQVACQENVTGPIEVPDHPLVGQTVQDCLFEAMDLDGLVRVLQGIRSGEIRVHSRDTTEPSPFSHEILSSKPYTFLDDAPLEERRARAVQTRRVLSEEDRALAVLDAAAIERVCDEAWPDPRDADELHEALLGFVALAEDEAAEWSAPLEELVATGRAAFATLGAGGHRVVFAAENLARIEALYAPSAIAPAVVLPAALARDAVDADEVAALLAEGHLACRGPLTAAELAQAIALPVRRVDAAIAQLEATGSVMRGRFRPGASEPEVCDRRLLARIHRYTLDRLRKEIEPVSGQDHVRFLLRWQHVAPGTRLEGKRGLLRVIEQLQGFDAPVTAWERDILPGRVLGYKPAWLDELCLSGDVTWGRLALGRAATDERARSLPASSVTPVSLVRRADLAWLGAGIRDAPPAPSNAPGPAADVLALLGRRGALFFDEIVAGSGRVRAEVERALWEGVARGLVTADGFQALRALSPEAREAARKQRGRARSSRPTAAGLPAGRWSLFHVVLDGEQPLGEEALAERWAFQLLRRYGIVCRALLERENLVVPWRAILRVLRRLEARGQVRGGRFVAGLSGEQYADPEAVDLLRTVRRTTRSGEEVVVAAVDPLNLVGIVTPGPRVPATPNGAVVWHDGLAATSER
ncbi:MAG: DEAD/DEAH box helicase [bacterium]